MMSPLLSVVVTVYNEEDNVRPLLEQLHAGLTGIDYELVYVDDGSRDNTIAELRAAAHPRLRVVELRKNYGQSLALMAGIDVSRGEYIATMDGDLQNDPSDIPAMLQMAQTGQWDMVAGNRVNRQDKVLLRKIPSAIANYLILRVTDQDARTLARNVAPSEIERRTADRLKTLPKYEALFFSEGQRQPAHLRLTT